jgi:hypothetical protein
MIGLAGSWHCFDGNLMLSELYQLYQDPQSKKTDTKG